MKIHKDEERDTDYINSLDEINKQMYMMLDRLYYDSLNHSSNELQSLDE